MASTPGYWDEQAAAFDDEPDHGLGDSAVHDAWPALLADLLPTEPARIVDLGCGTGSLSVLMARHGHRVTAIDYSPRMIEIARRKALSACVSVDFRIADAACPPLEHSSFDVIFARHMLWTFTDPADVLGRWLELADQNGRLVLIEGRWSSGAGLSSAEIVGLLRAHQLSAKVRPLGDECYWGKPITDERYAISSSPVILPRDNAHGEPRPQCR